MEYTVKKSTCERYDFRFEHCGWAIITLDENGGVFNTQSDYGDYSYRWPHHGRKSFKHFIIEIAQDSHYFLKKVASETWFDYYKHLRKWKKAIIKSRRDGEIYAGKAREAWAFIDSLDDYANSPDIISAKFFESEVVRDIAGDEWWYTFEIEKEYSPDARNFMEIVMPALADVLQKEILHDGSEQP